MAARRARCKAPSTASPSTGTSRRWTSGASHGCIDDASPPSRATREAPHSAQPAHQFVDLLGGVADDPPRDRIAGVGMPHHQRREGRIVRGGRVIHPGNGLERIVVEAHHHVAREAGADGALVIGAQRQADRMQPEIGAAALVGYRKAIAADPDLASADNGKADAAGSDDDDAAVAGAMRADAGDRRVMSVNDGAERMRPQHELLERAFAADAGKPDGSMHGAERVGVKPGFLERGAAGLFHFGQRAVDAEAQRGRARQCRSRASFPPRPRCARGSPCRHRRRRRTADRVAKLLSSCDPLDIRAALHQLAVERLVTAIEMVDAVDGRFAFGDQGGEDQAHRCAQVGGHHLRAMQPLDAAHQRRRALQRDVGAEPPKLGHVHESALEHGFADDRRA